ncbi:helix-turn-helix transcriptional regulator [bacterium]|nr:helix-turn-helix transcriptional regulator [bacterium]
MKLLSRKDELILLAIRSLEENAYGVTIRDYIKTQAGISIPFGAIYAPLAKLVRDGLVASYNSDPVNERGGRSKILYKLREPGVQALQEMEAVHAAMWGPVSSFSNKG